MNEELKNELRTFGALMLEGVKNDQTKAAEALKAVNKLLVENPKVIPFISNPENQETFKKIKVPKSASPVELMTFVGELKTLTKKFKEA